MNNEDIPDFEIDVEKLGLGPGQYITGMGFPDGTYVLDPEGPKNLSELPIPQEALTDSQIVEALRIFLYAVWADTEDIFKNGSNEEILGAFAAIVDGVEEIVGVVHEEIDWDLKDGT